MFAHRYCTHMRIISYKKRGYLSDANTKSRRKSDYISFGNDIYCTCSNNNDNNNKTRVLYIYSPFKFKIIVINFNKSRRHHFDRVNILIVLLIS